MQPVAEIARIAHEAGALVLCDAAQTVGHCRSTWTALGVDLLAAPGHKGLLGRWARGCWRFARTCRPRLASVRQGGTGTQSERHTSPTSCRQVESGNLNVPGILGLGAGVEYLAKRGHCERRTAWRNS